MLRTSLLQLPNFKKLYLAGLTSELGSFISEMALMLLLFDLSGENKSYLGICRATFLIFLTIGGLYGGALGEKYNRRNILILCEVARMPAIISLFFIHNPSWPIVVNGFIAFFTGVFNPSRQALINDLVPQSKIKTANSLFGSTMAILHLLGPLVGSIIYGLTKRITEIALFDLLTYAAGIILISRIRYKTPTLSQKKLALKTKTFADIMEGLKFIKQRKDLCALYINAMVEGTCVGILIPMLLPYTREVLHKGEIEFGVILSSFGLGGAIGGYLCHRLSNSFRSGAMIVFSISIEPLMMAFWLMKSGFYYSLFWFFLWGLLAFSRISAQLNYIAETVESDYLTRAHSLLDLAFVLPNITGGILMAILSSHFSVLSILSFTSAFFFLFIFLRLFTPSMRALFTALPRGISREIQSGG